MSSWLVQARLGSPAEYQSMFPVMYPAGLYNIDPSIDPAVVTPLVGARLQQLAH